MIVVRGQFPRNAHTTIPDDVPVVVVSKHRNTDRGLRNAVHRAMEAAREYMETHGNAAAFRVEIVMPSGETLDYGEIRWLWEEYCAEL